MMNKIENYELIEAQEEVKVDFAIMLNNLLDEKKLSYTDLAKLTGKSKSLVSRIMGGSNNLTIETMVSMLFVLDEKIVISTESKLQAEYGRVLNITSASPITNLSKRQPYHIGNFRPLALEA
jgi:DNA-binding helix-turn-helix protein